MKFARNGPCYCGSKVKYKKCHYLKEWQNRVNDKSAITEKIKAMILQKVETDKEGRKDAKKETKTKETQGTVQLPKLP